LSHAYDTRPSKARAMSIDTSILVCGIGETASAIARRLFAEGYAVAIHQETPPRTLWRGMAFANAWFDGRTELDGFEARCVEKKMEFLYGLRGRSFIPVLRRPFAEAVEMWSWDGVVAAEESGLKPKLLKNQADITVGLGTAFIAGDDCDMVIEVDGPNPGEVVKSGRPPERRPRWIDADFTDGCKVITPMAGRFSSVAMIGAPVTAGELLGFVGSMPILAPVGGKIRGLVRPGVDVTTGAAVAEIAPVSHSLRAIKRYQLVARAVAFAIEMESGGWTPVPFAGMR
jgi:xanthine dehydrogenase accessory factor